MPRLQRENVRNASKADSSLNGTPLGPQPVIVRRWPALEQRTAAIDLEQALHLPAAGIEIVLEHLDVRVDLRVGGAAGGELMRSRHHASGLEATLEVKPVENSGHASSVLAQA